LPNDDVPLSRTQTELMAGRALVRVWTEDLDGAWRDLRRVQSAALDHGPFVDLLIALFYLSDVAYRLGLWDDAITYGQLAVSAAEDADQPFIYALVHGAASWALAGRGDWEAAEAHVRASAVAAVATGDAASAVGPRQLRRGWLTPRATQRA
jgi:ATP/maltotriose-dependent transcriptional regulator MalT